MNPSYFERLGDREAPTSHEVGRVAAVWRYPVKSMAGETLEEMEVSWHGVAGDRRGAFVRDGLARSGFPWLTMRERPDMGRYRPSFVEPDRPDASLTMVRTTAGAELDVLILRLPPSSATASASSSRTAAERRSHGRDESAIR